MKIELRFYYFILQKQGGKVYEEKRIIKTQNRCGFSHEKLGIMDFRAELDGKIKCNIEIQLQPHKYENERILYYWAYMYKRQVKRSEKYAK